MFNSPSLEIYQQRSDPLSSLISTFGVVVTFLPSKEEPRFRLPEGAIFQILSQKGELISARSKLKRLQIEIDNLRNESIDEDIDIDDIEDIENR